MKKLKLFFALFAMLALGVGNAWAESIEINTTSSGVNGSYRDYEFDVNSITFGCTQWMKNNNIQAKKSTTNSLYNVDAIPGTITSIVVKQTGRARAIKVYGGTSTKPTTQITSPSTAAEMTFDFTGKDFTYFSLTTPANACYFDKITINYTPSGGGVTPVASLTANPTTIDFGTVYEGAAVTDKTVAVSFENLTGDVTYSGLSTPFTSTGTVSNNGDKITIAANTSTIGEYSQTLTIASAADSKTAEVTVKMNVIAPFEGKKLVFDFVTHPSGWPAAKANATAGSYVYTLDEVDYTFSHTKSGDGIYLGGTSITSGYLMLVSGNKLGLPAIKGYKLVKVDGTLNGSGSPSTASQVSITNAGGTVISGGAAQTWDIKGGTKTYNLTDTEANTVYYLTVANKNLQMITLALYYEEVAGAADIPDAPTLTASQTFETETFTVEISAVDGATIHYTLDGSDPTEASTTYSAPFTVNATTTVKAIAVKDGVASNVATATYTKVSVIEKTCAEAAALCTSSTESTDKYRVEGYVTAIETAYSAQYNNITVWMADTRNGSKVLQAYRATPTVEADKAVKVGDKIEVVGKLKLYNSTPEIVSGTYTITQLDPVYNVNITSEHGTATATPASAVEGTEITLSVEVETGWVFQSWTVTDASSNTIEVTDNKFTMPASDVTVVANYTESVAPDAVLKLSANGVVTSNTYKVGETVKLPETIVNDCVKMFVGWSADANRATAPEYAPGADFELTAEEHILYAVYATAQPGSSLSSIFTEDFASCKGTGGNDDKWSGSIASGTLSLTDWELVKGSPANGCAKFGTGSVKGSAQTPVIALNGDATLTFKAAAWSGDGKTLNLSATGATLGESSVTLKEAEWTEYTVAIKGATGAVNIKFEAKNASNNRFFLDDVVVSQAAIEYSDYKTTCEGALTAPTFSVAEGIYNTAQSIVITAADGTIYYTLDGSTPTSASTQYTEAIVLDECGEFTIKAIAIGTESESPVASATYTLALPIPANDAENPYTGTQAIEVHHGGCYVEETLVYVTGTVQTAEYDSEYKNYKITFEDGFVCFRLQETATDKFTEDKIGAGDVIVVCGKLTDYQSKCQLAAGCYLVKHTPSVKADAELAWNPEAVTLTVDDVFSAPTLSNPHSVSGITYESSNEDVATVSAEGVIALVDGAVGTATITASFLGDATYKPATATCTIQVKPVQEDCEGSDDFETATTANNDATSYKSRTTDAGWKAANAAVAELEGYNYIIINGKTTEVGTITSPVLNGGIGSIKIRYANTYSEENGVSFRLDIKQNGEIVKTYTITHKTGVTQNTVYTELIKNINIEGDFQMVFTNLHPTNNSTKNKDRVSIGRLCWTGYVAPTPVVIRDGLTVGQWGTLCPTQNVENPEGATFYQIAYLEEKDGLPFNMHFYEVEGNLEAGQPYFFIASATEIKGVKSGEVKTKGSNVNGFYGYIGETPLDLPYQASFDVESEVNTFVIWNNSVFRINAATKIKSERCYININSSEPSRTSTLAPVGARRITMGVSGINGQNTATGMENVDASAQPVKTIINGQLFILRGEKMYDAQGKLVK